MAMSTEDNNCEATAEVDLGYGVVTVRCTRLGTDHEEHRIDVRWANRKEED